MSDVGPLVAEWQGRVPLTYQAAGVFPDPGALAAWMEQMLQSSGGLKITRSSVDPYDQAYRYLTSLGVDVERELAAVDRAHEGEKHRVRAAADGIRDLALSLKAAEKALLVEARGVNAGAAGYTAATLGEAEARVARLRAALEAACCDDPQLARSVRRSVA